MIKYMTFRIHNSKKATARTRIHMLADSPELASNRNVGLDECDDHELGLCDNLLCRLLHALEERCADFIENGRMSWHVKQSYLEELHYKDSSPWTPWDARDVVIVEAPHIRDWTGESNQTPVRD